MPPASYGSSRLSDRDDYADGANPPAPVYTSNNSLSARADHAMKCFFAIACIVAAGLVSVPVPAQQAVIPPLVVKDGQGDIIGPVVGFLTVSQPVIRLLDAFDDMGTPRVVPVFLAVLDSDTLRAAVGTTYFSADNCAGTPYHQANIDDVLTGLSVLTGYAYSVAEFTGTIHLVRSDAGVGGTINTPYDSVYSNGVCSNNSGTGFLKPGVVVMDLEAEFPPSYVAQ